MEKENDQNMNLAKTILISLVLGIIAGILIHTFLPDGRFKNDIIIDGVLHLIGQIFLRSIMMLVVPLVFISLVNGASSMGDIQQLGRVGGKTIAFFMTTTAIAIIIALILGSVIKPGEGLNMAEVESVESVESIETPEKLSLTETIIEMVPKNPIKSMAEGEMLPIIVFAIIVGIGLSLLGNKVASVKLLFIELNELMMKLVEMVMTLAPIGVFGLISKTFAEIGIEALVPLAKYVIAVYIGLIIHGILVYGLLLRGFTGLSPKIFYKKFLPVISLGFSTASSGATLPLSLDIVENELGVSQEIAAFTLPLGNTINMDGTAIMQGIATFFVAQVYAIDLSLGDLATVVITATLASIGTAGVPGAGTIMLSMVLQSIGLPLDGIALIMGIDRLVDMGRTAMNVTGDAVCTIVIADQEGELDRNQFNKP